MYTVGGALNITDKYVYLRLLHVRSRCTFLGFLTAACIPKLKFFRKSETLTLKD